MLWTTIRKELFDHLLQLRFLVCAGLCVVLAAISILVLRADLRAKQADFNADRALYHKQAEEYNSYGDLKRQGIRVDRPPQNFQVLFYGMEKSLDRTAVISESFLPGFEGDLNNNPMVLMFPVADLLFVVGVVLSLLAFFISYDAVAGERESGTLKLLLSYPLPRDTLILAKWTGGYLVLALPFLVALVLGALLISTSEGIVFGAEEWEAFVLSGVVSLLLIAVMFSIGLFVSVRTRRASTAILTLLALWVLLALVVPNAGPYLAEIAAPVPDVGEVERRIAVRTKALSDEFWGQWRSQRRRMREMTPQQRRQARQEMMQGRTELQTKINKATEEVVRDFERQLHNQVDSARQLTRLSPVAAYVYANTDIGITGVRHEQNLVRELRNFQREFVRYVDEKSAGQASGTWWGSVDKNYSVEDLPVFQYRPESLGARLEARSTDMLLLALFAVAFFMGAFVAFLRLDIT